MAVPVENITVLPPEPKRVSRTHPSAQESFADILLEDILREEDTGRGDEADQFTDPREEPSAQIFEAKDPLSDLSGLEVPVDKGLATGYSPIGSATGSANTPVARGRILDLSV